MLPGEPGLGSGKERESCWDKAVQQRLDLLSHDLPCLPLPGCSAWSMGSGAHLPVENYLEEVSIRPAIKEIARSERSKNLRRQDPAPLTHNGRPGP
eukprot:SM000045S16288  [mRNA]  locus=s45:627487:628085:- [translate_table: standard]